MAYVRAGTTDGLNCWAEKRKCDSSPKPKQNSWVMLLPFGGKTRGKTFVEKAVASFAIPPVAEKTEVWRKNALPLWFPAIVGLLSVLVVCRDLSWCFCRRVYLGICWTLLYKAQIKSLSDYGCPNINIRYFRSLAQKCKKLCSCVVFCSSELAIILSCTSMHITLFLHKYTYMFSMSVWTDKTSDYSYRALVFNPSFVKKKC